MRPRSRIALLAAAAFALAQPATAQAAASPDVFAGTWARTWPASACAITLQIRGDGTLTAADGEQVVDATWRRLGPADVEGIVPVQVEVTRDNGAKACSTGARSQRVGAILVYAHGDAISLCDNPANGSCDRWFSRTGPQRARPAPVVDFESAIERDLYAVLPENRHTFELIPAVSSEPPTFPAKDGSRDAPQPCARFADLHLIGDGWSGVQFTVLSCQDVGSIDDYFRPLVARARQDLPRVTDLTEAQKHSLGVSVSDERLADGAELLYIFDVTRGVDASLPGKTAIFIDAARRHAVVLVDVDMSMGERAPGFGDDPLGPDPAATLKDMATRLGRDPLVAK